MPDERTYIRVHDGMPDHPKVDGLSDKAFRLLVEMWCWCSRHLTDGRIPTATWRKRATPKARRELVDAGLVVETADGVTMHDYLEHQRSAADVEQIREAKRTGGSLGNHMRWHVRRNVADPQCPHCIADRSHMRSESDRSSDTPGGHREVTGDEVRGSSPHATVTETGTPDSAPPDRPQAPDQQERDQTASHMRSQNRSHSDRKTSPETTTETNTPVLQRDIPPPVSDRACDPRNGGGGTPTDNPDLLDQVPDDDLERLVGWMRQRRPDWTDRDIRAALHDPAVTRHPWPQIRAAAEQITDDDTTRWPSRLAQPGPWWTPDPKRPSEPDPAAEVLAARPRFDPDGTNAAGRALMHAVMDSRNTCTPPPHDQPAREAS